jgi:hypothetical protein
MTKRIFTYAVHLAVATFAIPMLTIFLSSSAYSIVALIHSANPRQFYSDHILSATVVAGLCLSYFVCGAPTSKPALWVWIPSTVGFIARILSWRATGSVLFHSGIVEHFFTANCQIQDFREATFAIRCGDKLFLTPMFVGGLSYSAGAAIRQAAQSRLSAASRSIERMSTSFSLVTTRFRAFVSVAFTGWVLALALHSQMRGGGLTGWKWQFSGLLPTWAVVIINIAFWGAIYWMGFAFASSPLRKEEKLVLVGFIGSIMLGPVRALLPRIDSATHVMQTLLSVVSFFAALAILVSFLNKRVNDTVSSPQNQSLR